MNEAGYTDDGLAYLKAVLPLPPTDNKIYENMKGGGKRLSTIAGKYKTTAAYQLIEPSLGRSVYFPKHVQYRMTMRIYFDSVENKGWTTGKAKNRYKKVDSQNRIKLIIDTVMDAIGVDDSHIFELHKYKLCDKDHSRVEVEVYQMTREYGKKDEVGISKD